MHVHGIDLLTKWQQNCHLHWKKTTVNRSAVKCLKYKESMQNFLKASDILIVLKVMTL